MQKQNKNKKNKTKKNHHESEKRRIKGNPMGLYFFDNKKK